MPAAQSPDKYRVIVRERAWNDIRRARQWYERRNPRAAAAFLLVIDNAVATVSEAPLRWAEHAPGMRRLVLQGFPYSLLYRVVDMHVQILAVTHQRRRPDLWRRGPADP